MSPAGAALGVPSRSEIEEWSTRDLDAAAGRWRASATQSDEAFAQHRANIVNTAWAGDAKDAALNRVTTDAVVVASQTAVQRAGTQIAEDGSRDIQAAKREALGAIAAAEADGFEVGEDLSVTDTREVDETEIAARTMAAREHAEDIRWFAERLSQTDEFVGKRLQDKAVELEGIRFDGERDDRSDSSVQLVDNKTGTDTEDNPEGTKEEQSGDRTWQDMLLPPEEPDGPDAERSKGGPDAAAGEDADHVDDGPPNPLDALAGEGSSADPDTPANVDEALFGPGAATPPSVLDRLAAQARGEKTPTDAPYMRSPLEGPIAAADPAIVDQQLARVETAQQAVAAAQADLDAAAAQTVMQGPGAGPGRDVTEPLTQALFDARADLTTQTEILENLNEAAAETGGRRVDVPALPPNADVQAFPAPPSVAEQAAEGLTEFSHDISEKTFGIVPDVAEIADVYANWGEHSGAEQLGAVLDTAGSLPLPGAKPLGEALQYGLDAFTAGRHTDDVVQPGIPHDVVDGPDAGPSPDIDHPSPLSDAPGSPQAHAPAADIPPPLPPDSPLFDGYDPTPPGPEFTNADGRLTYPDDSLPEKPYAIPGTVVDSAQIPQGTVIDRFGYPSGAYLSPEGVPFAERALPPDSAFKPYYQYVVDDPSKLPPGWRIEQSQAAPWFHQPGGGTQYRIIAPDGDEASVDALVEWGFLRRGGK
ncbi:TNT domain-containing protein [Mycolicibacterium tusciae]|uniref:TNT domain-containing protein n=1 Tax=Mycolicibacterium tusciae TaxID=75922 RepID=UPI001F1C6260|nr:TNT domain-containing protein [Mycolicibacterium tusciae]